MRKKNRKENLYKKKQGKALNTLGKHDKRLNILNKKCSFPNCSFRYARGRWIAYQMHVRRVHEKDEKPFHCLECPMEFSKYSFLVYHRKFARKEIQEALRISKIDLTDPGSITGVTIH